jgi:hypothetical protein
LTRGTEYYLQFHLFTLDSGGSGIGGLMETTEIADQTDNWNSAVGLKSGWSYTSEMVGIYHGGRFAINIWFEPAEALCPADIAPPGGNGAVDVDDLLAVISGWGPCPAPPVPCLPNISTVGNSANRVDVDDLLAVISAWGPCE